MAAILKKTLSIHSEIMACKIYLILYTVASKSGSTPIAPSPQANNMPLISNVVSLAPNEPG